MKEKLFNIKNERKEVLKKNFYNKYESDELLKNSLLYKSDNETKRNFILLSMISI